jgi:hypothetical protein
VQFPSLFLVAGLPRRARQPRKRPHQGRDRQLHPDEGHPERHPHRHRVPEGVGHLRSQRLRLDGWHSSKCPTGG